MTMTWDAARELTLAELRAEASARFGDDSRQWAFVCPSCGDVATLADFEAAAGGFQDAAAAVGQHCIGRLLGALDGDAADAGRSAASRGCDFAAYGLIPGPWKVTLPDGAAVASFALAPSPAAAGDAGELVEAGGQPAGAAGP